MQLAKPDWWEVEFVHPHYVPGVSIYEWFPLRLSPLLEVSFYWEIARKPRVSNLYSKDMFPEPLCSRKQSGCGFGGSTPAGCRKTKRLLHKGSTGGSTGEIQHKPAHIRDPDALYT